MFLLIYWTFEHIGLFFIYSKQAQLKQRSKDVKVLHLMCYLVFDIVDFSQVHEGRNHEVRELVQNAGLQVRLLTYIFCQTFIYGLQPYLNHHLALLVTSDI